MTKTFNDRFNEVNSTLVSNYKLLLVMGAVLSYGGSYVFLAGGYPAWPLYISLFASSTAIAMMLVEWARN